ncbi:MAG: hypothetical protein IKT46_05195 [Clostridia bacterium]|nr:hypothetical protein [Clostridia bacterium]
MKTYISKTRKRYIIKLIFRCCVLVLCGVLYFVHPKSFEIAQGMNFFKEFSVFHILWVLWMADMLLQIIPVKSPLPIGSRKLQASAFKPSKIWKDSPAEALKKYTVKTARSAYLVMLLWAALIAVIGILYYTGIIDRSVLILISVAFYVCDLICVLIWCPFRLMMKTKCCTTCRIFNWDHMMMFSPMIFIWSFYSVSLWVMALISFALWEISILIHPERFWEATNTALQCSECTDKLCTQYCKKLRK